MPRGESSGHQVYDCLIAESTLMIGTCRLAFPMGGVSRKQIVANRQQNRRVSSRVIQVMDLSFKTFFQRVASRKRSDMWDVYLLCSLYMYIDMNMALTWFWICAWSTQDSYLKPCIEPFQISIPYWHEHEHDSLIYFFVAIYRSHRVYVLKLTIITVGVILFGGNYLQQNCSCTHSLGWSDERFFFY